MDYTHWDIDTAFENDEKINQLEAEIAAQKAELVRMASEDVEDAFLFI
jgi:hypothetical protein